MSENFPAVVEKGHIKLTEYYDSTYNYEDKLFLQCTCVGFYLTPITSAKAALKRRLFNDELNAVRHQFHQVNEVLVKYVKKLKKEKYLESKNTGYDSFYILPAGNDLSVDDEIFEVNGNATATTLTKAFMKFNKSRQINRVLVSRFITQIAV